jgi:hypothetical protein
MASKLTASARYRTDLSPAAFLATLRGVMEPLDGGFKLVSKLSPGGIVVRTLRAPETDLGWFGTIREHKFSVAMIVRDKSGSPFEPIVRGEVRARDGGSEVEVELSPHPNARMFSILFTLGGGLLAAASLVAISQSPALGVMGLVVAAIFLAFPGFRARVGFRHTCRATLTAFEAQLGLERQSQNF